MKRLTNGIFELQKSFILTQTSTSFVAHFSFSHKLSFLWPNLNQICQKWEWMPQRGICFKRQHRPPYNQIKCLPYILILLYITLNDLSLLTLKDYLSLPSNCESDWYVLELKCLLFKSLSLLHPILRRWNFYICKVLFDNKIRQQLGFILLHQKDFGTLSTTMSGYMCHF